MAGSYGFAACTSIEWLISALYETLIERKRQPLPLNGTNEGVERVKAWLEAFDKAAAELPLD